MIEDVMVQIFLETTGLSGYRMPEGIYDTRFPNDMFQNAPADVNAMSELLNEHQLSHFYRTLIMAYLLDIPSINGYTWGWFRADANSGWELIPICYSTRDIKSKAYTVKGTSTSPWNMVLFLRKKDSYIELLETALSKCEEFVQKYRPYNYSDISLVEQINFISKLDSKIKEIQVSLDLIRSI
mgnify:CR=1 FL=1